MSSEWPLDHRFLDIQERRAREQFSQRYTVYPCHAICWRKHAHVCAHTNFSVLLIHYQSYKCLLLYAANILNILSQIIFITQLDNLQIITTTLENHTRTYTCILSWYIFKHTTRKADQHAMHYARFHVSLYHNMNFMEVAKNSSSRCHEIKSNTQNNNNHQEEQCT